MPEPANSPHKLEPIIWLLFGAVVFFSLMLVAISKWSPNDGQTFQVVSSLVTGFAGALMMRVKPPDTRLPLPPGSTQVKETTSVTQVAEEPKQ